MKENEKEICLTIRTLIEQEQYKEAYEVIVDHMKLAPDDAPWHNFLGILYEKQGDHVGGMKHFRAAWALDPAYLPARWNMDLYGGFQQGKKTCAYLEEECQHVQMEKEEKLQEQAADIHAILMRRHFFLIPTLHRS